MRSLAKLTMAIVFLAAAALAQQVQQNSGTGWSNTTTNTTTKVPAPDFGEGFYGGVEYFVWEVGTTLYRVKKADVPADFRKQLQKGVDADRRAILTTEAEGQNNGQLKGGAVL